MGVQRIILIVLLLAAGTGPVQQPETLSLLGTPLFAPSIDSDTRKQLEADLAAAQAAYKEKADADRALRLADVSVSLGHFGDAIEVETRAIEAFPNDLRLYAARGRTFITLRKFDLAVRDLSKALQPIEGQPAVDPAVQYDLGLAHYLKGEFGPAADALEMFLKGMKSPEKIGAANFWLYVSLERLHKPDEANGILRHVANDSDDPYVRVLQFYTGARPENSLDTKGASGVTAAYGIAVRGLWTGAIHEARASFKRIVEKHEKEWTVPAYIAAEAELARLTPAERKKLKLKMKAPQKRPPHDPTASQSDRPTILARALQARVTATGPASRSR
jgi:tetratricopeptide (TPR) repeat protein